jgi:release factor glutamine methyltransferase
MTDASGHTHFTVAQILRESHSQGLLRLEAQMLLLHALQRSPNDRAWLLSHADDTLSIAQHSLFTQSMTRRLNHEPVAYIIGMKEFFGLTLQVDARVLDPRDDTETLVEWALSCMADVDSPRVIDLGTGSGAIALALKHARPDANVHAVDASSDALAVAHKNAQQLQLNITFHHGSWFTSLPEEKFDAIVSNPPYVAQADTHLSALKQEPLSALVSGADGLDDIRTIVQQAPAHLKPGGWLLLEHGHDQAHAVQTLLANQGFESVQSRPDLAGIMRCTGGHWPTVK